MTVMMIKLRTKGYGSFHHSAYDSDVKPTAFASLVKLICDLHYRRYLVEMRNLDAPLALYVRLGHLDERMRR